MAEPWKIALVPENAGLSSRGILNYLDAVKESGIEPHSILVLKDGMLACKMNFAPYDDQTPHILFSLSKSFCSAAAGGKNVCSSAKRTALPDIDGISERAV